MNRAQIELEARRLQYEIWHKRTMLFPMGEPPLSAMFEPRVAAKVLDLEYEFRPRISSGHEGTEAAGIFDRSRGIIAVSSRFKHTVQRFTGAHEIGHAMLHPSIGDGIAHRDKPIFSVSTVGRPPAEQDADYFAACLLAPRKAVIEQFKARFWVEPPMRLDENVAFHLRGNLAHDLLAAPHGSLAFAAAVAGAHKFDRAHFSSLAEHFDVSVSAMAIRLQELELVRE